VATKKKKLTKKKLASLARTAKRKALGQWSLDVRARDNHQCCVCGSSNDLNSHHLIPKERFPQFQYDLANGIAVCPNCHKFGSYSAHRHPIWFSEWLRANRPDQFAYVTDRLAGKLMKDSQ
jgi:5-methylcytosine-specific restriction endonuclease McrA